MKEFEYRGLWWLPERPEDRVPGILTFDLDEGANLELLGSFGRTEDFSENLLDLFDIPELRVILGFSEKGKPITLLGCKMSKGSSNLSGVDISAFSSDMVFIGEHFQRPEDIGFEKLIVEYLHLDEWAGISGFRSTMPADPREHSFTIEHKIPEPIPFSTREIRGCLRFGSRHKARSFPTREMSIVEFASFTVEYPKKTPLEDLLKTTHHLQNFLSLAVRRAVRLLSIRGMPVSGAGPGVEIYYRPVGGSYLVKKVLSANMLFTLHDLPGGLDNALGRWLEGTDKLGPVHSLFFGTVYKPRDYLEQQFLSLVTALEVYHRRAVYVPDPPDKHEKRKREILNATPEKHKGWLERKLKHPEEPTLEERLHEIFRRHLEVMQAVVGRKKKTRSDFIKEVVDVRNNHAHFPERLKGIVVQGVELHPFNQKLKLLLEACLMKEIGFEDEKIREAVVGRR